MSQIPSKKPSTKIALAGVSAIGTIGKIFVQLLIVYENNFNFVFLKASVLGYSDLVHQKKKIVRHTLQILITLRKIHFASFNMDLTQYS